MKNILHIFAICTFVIVYATFAGKGSSIENTRLHPEKTNITCVSSQIVSFISEASSSSQHTESDWTFGDTKRQISNESIFQQIQNRYNPIIVKHVQIFPLFAIIWDKINLQQQNTLYITGRTLLLQKRILRI